MTVKKNIFLVNKKCLNEFALKAGKEKKDGKGKKDAKEKNRQQRFFHNLIGSM